MREERFTVGKYDGWKVVGGSTKVNTPHEKSPIDQSKTTVKTFETDTQKIKVRETTRENGDKDRYTSVRNK